MNCYNSSAYLQETLDTVLSQTYQNYEVIFWDNQSTDSSAEIFKKINDPRYKYFLSPRFTPLGEARNLAIEKAQGELIAFLDCDDLWLPKKLELCVPPFKSSKVGIVISDTWFFNEKKRKNSIRFKPTSNGASFPGTTFPLLYFFGNRGYQEGRVRFFRRSF
ncbi:MAG: glycosyltransferase family A protein [Bdellovibrionota bacterium]